VDQNVRCIAVKAMQQEAGALMPMLVSASSRQVVDIPSHLNWFLLTVTALMLIGILAAPETKGKFE
jgi:hypothetical protein